MDWPGSAQGAMALMQGRHLTNVVCDGCGRTVTQIVVLPLHPLCSCIKAIMDAEERSCEQLQTQMLMKEPVWQLVRWVAVSCVFSPYWHFDMALPFLPGAQAVAFCSVCLEGLFTQFTHLIFLGSLLGLGIDAV